MNQTAEHVQSIMGTKPAAAAIAVQEQGLGAIVFGGTLTFLADVVLVC
jgi:hypothetical protein